VAIFDDHRALGTDVIAALADMGEDITKCLLAGTFKYSGDQVRYAVEHNIPKVQLANDDITKELLAYGKEQGIIFTYATIDSSTNALAALETGVDVILTNKLTVIKAGIH
jgi:hypothetical protein